VSIADVAAKWYGYIRMADAVGSSHATNVHLSMLDWHLMHTVLRNAAVADINLSICRSLNTVDATYDDRHGSVICRFRIVATYRVTSSELRFAAPLILPLKDSASASTCS